jgi:hypothetical protein
MLIVAEQRDLSVEVIEVLLIRQETEVGDFVLILVQESASQTGGKPGWDREHANPWGSLPHRRDCLVAVCEAKARMPRAEGSLDLRRSAWHRNEPHGFACSP